MIERAGVVDEDVDGAELLDRPRNRRADLLAVGYVAAHCQRAATERTDLLHGLLGVHEALRPCSRRERAPAVRVLRELGLDEDVRDRDVRAGSSQRERVGATEPARAARHEGDAP